MKSFFVFISKSHLLKYKNSKLRKCKRDFKYAYEVHRYLEIRVCFEMAKKKSDLTPNVLSVWRSQWWNANKISKCNKNEDNKWLKIPFFRTISQKLYQNKSKNILKLKVSNDLNWLKLLFLELK